MMKRFIILALTACAGLMSCTANSRHHERESVELSFDVVVSTQSKSLHNTKILHPEDVPFGFWAMSLPAGQSWSANSGNASIAARNAVAVFSGDSRTWKPAEQLSWQSDGSSATIIAYSPFRQDASFSLATGVTVPNFHLGAGEELLYTSPIADKRLISSGGRVLVNFQRALASVGFSVVSGLEEKRRVVVRRIVVDKAYMAGSFSSLPTPRWTPDEASLEELVCFEGEKALGGLDIVGERVDVLPHKAEKKISVLCDIWDGETVLEGQLFECAALLNWEIGKIHEYRLTLRSNYSIELQNI